ncbi:DEAD/DEAH box helicase, partial [Candidatus Woesebacteria bacterium]|nr:DEAD/DEAH box helicase [Candidatus Woesebacteria bacterium]
MDLRDGVSTVPLIGPAYERRLEKLGINTIGDLLGHVPHRYLDFSVVSPIANAQRGEVLTIKGKVTSSKNIYTRYGKQLQIIKVEDSTGEISAIWFNQPYLIGTLFEGVQVSLAGKIGEFSRAKALISPEYEVTTNGRSVHTGRLVPVYPETAGLSSKWLRSRINKAYIETRPDLTDFLPGDALKELNFEDLFSAITHVHYPNNLTEAESGKVRLAFNELFFLQLKSTYRKIDWQKTKPAFELDTHEKEVGKFLNNLSFKLTSSQGRSVKEILDDLKKGYPMNRLLEGDVGSGKTVVAATAAFVSFLNGYQSVFMAPTQILAQQHFNTLSELFKPYKIRVSLITSDIKSFELGRNDVFVGTHALIHNKISFDKVALVVIDEQHRFGVEQREHLMKKAQNRRIAPHTLTMTATPIPRTVALTIYGDLDLSTLDDLPKGRQKITTWVVPENKRGAAFEWIKEIIEKEKTQAFIVCPLIEESQNESMKQIAAATKK